MAFRYLTAESHLANCLALKPKVISPINNQGSSFTPQAVSDFTAGATAFIPPADFNLKFCVQF
nr:hypothetical protein [Serratia fonticola]